MTEAVVCVYIVLVPLHAQIPTLHPNFWSTQRTRLGVDFCVSFQGLMVFMLCAAGPPASEILSHSERWLCCAVGILGCGVIVSVLLCLFSSCLSSPFVMAMSLFP